MVGLLLLSLLINLFRSDRRVIANYMMWHVVLRFAPSLSLKFRDTFYEYRKSVSGVAAEDPRWQDCLGVVGSSFGMPFGLLFVDEAFEGKSKESVRQARSLPLAFHSLQSIYDTRGQYLREWNEHLNLLLFY